MTVTRKSKQLILSKTAWCVPARDLMLHPCAVFQAVRGGRASGQDPRKVSSHSRHNLAALSAVGASVRLGLTR